MKRIMLPIAGVLAAALVVGSVWYFWPQPEYRVTISTVPQQVDLVIDGVPMGTIETGSTLVLQDETVTIRAGRDEFSTYEREHTFDRSADGQEVIVTLEPETEAAAALLYEEEQYNTEQHMTEAYDRDAADAYERFPILRELPEEQADFRAYQGLSEDGEHEFAIHVYVSDHERGQASFEAWLADALDQGTIDDYEIVYHVE